MLVNDNLSAFFLVMYNDNPASLSFLFEGSVPKYVMLHSYRVFVREGLLTQIELLPDEEKIKLTNECRTTGINFTNDSLRNSARILHTIKFINANS